GGGGGGLGLGPGGGAGVGTPELGSLRKFLGEGELEDLWRQPGKKLFHLSRETSPFSDRAVYNQGLWKRWGAPTSLEDYLMKAQLMDYEATRAQFDAYTAMWSAERPATGAIYWMLNNAWPGLHWNLWDYYMRPAGSFFGAKTGLRVENVVFDYVRRAVWLVNRSLDKRGRRSVEVQVIAPDGKVVHRQTTHTTTAPNTSKNILSLGGAFGNAEGVVFIRLVLSGADGKVLSRNVYWVAKDPDVLDWENSTWYHTPVTKYADYTALNRLSPAHVEVDVVKSRHDEVAVTLENKSAVPAFFVSLNLVDGEGKDVQPLTWEDNYVTLWPKERMRLKAKAVGTGKWEPSHVQVVGKNVNRRSVRVVR
ncbi:Exo-beta-D-glucosaminidase, partial [Staphylotrichum tortipilum]